MACPKCGGVDRVELAPGFFECQSQTLFGVVPTGHVGNPAPIAHYRVCAHRYQESTGIGPSLLRACGCGFFAVAACTSCGDPLCGEHATKYEGRVLCPTHLAQARVQASEDAAADARRASAAREAAIAHDLSTLQTSDDYEELTAAIPGLVDVDVPDHTVRRAAGALFTQSGRVPQLDLLGLAPGSSGWFSKPPRVTTRIPLFAYRKHGRITGREGGGSVYRGISPEGISYEYLSFRCARPPWGADGYVVPAGDVVRRREGAAGQAFMLGVVTNIKPVTLPMLKEWIYRGNEDSGYLFTEFDGSEHSAEVVGGKEAYEAEAQAYAHLKEPNNSFGWVLFANGVEQFR